MAMIGRRSSLNLRYRMVHGDRLRQPRYLRKPLLAVRPFRVEKYAFLAPTAA
jgi:hypothetical protein